jgi:hypothetical protein
LLKEPDANDEIEHMSTLLQDNCAYADGRRLLVVRSQRVGRGYDVNLVSDGDIKSLSDCGDDVCGQPSLKTGPLYSRAALNRSRTVRQPHCRVSATLRDKLRVMRSTFDLRSSLVLS